MVINSKKNNDQEGGFFLEIPQGKHHTGKYASVSYKVKLAQRKANE